MKKFLITLIMAITVLSINVMADENEFTRLVTNLKNSPFFTDYKDMNENGYKTFIESNNNTIAIIGKYNGETQYILYYEYNPDTGILTYEVSDLISQTNRKNLEKQISAALVWNQYLVEAIGGKETLANYKTNDACSMTLDKNGIEIVSENLGGHTTSEWQGYLVKYDEIYTSLKIDLKNGIRLDRGNTVNKLTNFTIGKGDLEKNPSTSNQSILLLAAGLVVSLGVIYISINKINKLRDVK